MTTGFLGLGDLAETDIMDSSFTGFDYPNNAQRVPVLSDGTSTRNEVLQQSGLTRRQATLGCSLEDADALVVRGYFESRETVTFTDRNGATRDVIVFDFTRTERFAGVWDCTAILLEMSDPVLAS